MFRFRLLNVVAQDLLNTRHRRRFFTCCDLAMVTASFGGAAAGGSWGARLFPGGLGIVPLDLVGPILGFLLAYIAFDSTFRLFSYLVRNGWFATAPPPDSALEQRPG